MNIFYRTTCIRHYLIFFLLNLTAFLFVLWWLLCLSRIKFYYPRLQKINPVSCYFHYLFLLDFMCYYFSKDYCWGSIDKICCVKFLHSKSKVYFGNSHMLYSLHNFSIGNNLLFIFYHWTLVQISCT